MDASCLRSGTLHPNYAGFLCIVVDVLQRRSQVERAVTTLASMFYLLEGRPSPCARERWYCGAVIPLPDLSLISMVSIGCIAMRTRYQYRAPVRPEV